MSITDGLRVGDIVTHSRTMEVAFAEGGYVELHDTVAPTVRIGLYDSHQGSDKIEVVKKAKPSAGDVLPGDEITDGSWDAGTVIQSVAMGYIYLLTYDDRWIGLSGASHSGADFRGGSEFKLLHVA